MDEKILLELKVMNRQLSQIRNCSPSLEDVYSRCQMELYDEN